MVCRETSVEVPESVTAVLSLTARLLTLCERFLRKEPIRPDRVLFRGDSVAACGLSGGDKLMAMLGMSPGVVGELGTVESKSSEDMR